MSQRTKRRKLKTGARRHVSLARAPWNGDHGTGTAAATAGTQLCEVLNDDGKNPNRVAQRRRVNVIETLNSLTLRQSQAAKDIQNAFGRVESLGSGSAMKERVDASRTSDAMVPMQVDAHSRLRGLMAQVLPSEQAIVQSICWRNERPPTLTRTERRRWMARFQQAMDRVADHLQY